MRKVVYIPLEDYQRYCAIASMYDIKVSSLINIAISQFYPYPVYVGSKCDISDEFGKYIKKL